MSKKHLKLVLAAPLIALVLFGGATALSLKPVNQSFSSIVSDSQNVPVTDRNGKPLSITYKAAWNSFDVVPLFEMPDLLKTSFLYSEDRRFYDHGGSDWKGRASALWQNLKHGRTVRGASTITEQVVRLINPRPRTIWSKWLEGIEAVMLERTAGKAEIFEFYLNQLPYAANRRGVVQAARYYFDRDLETLSPKEILALVVLARAPSSYDLYRHPDRLEKPLDRLAEQLNASGKISHDVYNDIRIGTLIPTQASMPVDARHFVRYARSQGKDKKLTATLDAGLQARVQAIVDNRLKRLSSKNVNNAGAIVIDHTNGDILAWVVGGANDPKTKAGEIDPILTPRQPGSTLKPFLYAMALEKGWTAATMIKDAPISEAVGSGLHRFRNYSNTYYGPLTLREALGNSLNIPAILTVNHVGVDHFLSRLHKLGFNSLDRGSQIYDEGIALGNGEVTLYELVRAYSVLANHGTYHDFHFAMDDYRASPSYAVYSEDVSSIISDILSDPSARSIEFGRDSILNYPIRTAAKTGTSTDYRDAWTVGYNDRYTVGLWMGNLDRTPMKDVTGSTGPALAMRSIFGILNQGRDVQKLYLSPALVQKDVCTRPGQDSCPTRTEWFIAGTETTPDMPAVSPPKKLELVRPTDGLMMAYDPRIPADHQKFRFELANLAAGDQVQWTLNGETLGLTEGSRFLWPVQKGKHELAVAILREGSIIQTIPPVSFIVK